MTDSIKAGFPRHILLFSRLEFAWLNKLVMQKLRERHGTRFSLVVPDATWVARVQSWLGHGDRLLIEADIVAEAKRNNDEPAAVLAEATRNESKYGLSYFKDVVQQDRSVSALFLGFAKRSAWARAATRDWLSICREINGYFRYFETLLKDQEIDLVVERPGGLVGTVCLHICMQMGIPSTWSLSSRYGSYLMWSYGPYLGTELLSHVYRELPQAPAIPGSELNPPADSAGNIKKSEEWRSFSTLLKKCFSTTRDHAIWTAQDILRRRKGRRLPYRAVIANHFAVWQAFRELDRLIEADEKKITSQRYMLFLLQLEPEFTTLSLAREFNDTLACLRQLAMALPADTKLVIKEHVTNIGNRDLTFYEDIARLPNVILADYRIRGIDLAMNAAAVATISGTVAIEATQLGKPVVIFAPHVEYAFLQSVTVITSFHDLPTKLRGVLRERSAAETEDIRRSGATYREAVKAVSYFAPNVPTFRGNASDMAEDQLERCLELLQKTYSMQKATALSQPSPAA